MDSEYPICLISPKTKQYILIQRNYEISRAETPSGQIMGRLKYIVCKPTGLIEDCSYLSRRIEFNRRWLSEDVIFLYLIRRNWFGSRRFRVNRIFVFFSRKITNHATSPFKNNKDFHTFHTFYGRKEKNII